MSQLNGLISCPQIQGDLIEFWDTCDPTKYREDTPLQNILNSSINSMGGNPKKMQERVSPGGGKVRQVEYIYSPRILTSEVSSNTGRDSCVSTNTIGETSMIVDVPEDYVQYDFLISPMELREKCKSNRLYFAEKLQQAIDVIIRLREERLTNSLELMYGGFSVGEPNVAAKIKTVATRQGVGSPNLDTDALSQISVSTTYAGYCDRPIILGGREMYDYMSKLRAGCCYTDGGYDIRAMLDQYGMMFVNSMFADAAFGTDGFISFAPGAIQLIEWLEYEGPDGNLNMVDTEALKFTVITDPRTGARLDLKIVLDCFGNYSVFLRSYFKLITLPTDMYYSGDRLYGVNQLNRFRINNA